MTKLSVNIDHVATLRQARRSTEPDPVHAAMLCEMAGAEGITVHLRSDRRHIQDRDLENLRQVIKTRLNIEMAANDDMSRVAAQIMPHMVTLVPERPDELTTEGGLDVALNLGHLTRVVKDHKAAGIVVSLFVDPDLEQIRAAAKTGCEALELNTGRYSDARLEDRDHELVKLSEAARAAAKLGFRVLAGHGLDYQNVTPVSILPQVEELNIGHALVARAVLVGLDQAVRDMRSLL